MKNQIKSHLEVVEINKVRQNIDQIRQDYFTESELIELNHRHIQTLAGFYAAKIALKKLIDQLNPDQNLSEKQIILTHKPNGAPAISEINAFSEIRFKEFQISISHTSENAYGFATTTIPVK